MKKSKRTKIILLSILVLFLSVSVASSVFAYGGDDSNNPTETKSDSVRFDNSEDSDKITRLLEERLASSIKVMEAQEALDDAQWLADYTVMLDQVCGLTLFPVSAAVGNPIGVGYQIIRREGSWIYGNFTGNMRTVEDYDNSTIPNKLFNYFLPYQPDEFETNYNTYTPVGPTPKVQILKK